MTEPTGAWCRLCRFVVPLAHMGDHGFRFHMALSYAAVYDPLHPACHQRKKPRR